MNDFCRAKKDNDEEEEKRQHDQQIEERRRALGIQENIDVEDTSLRTESSGATPRSPVQTHFVFIPQRPPFNLTDLI